MAEYTENYNLKKPAQEDFYNVDDFNNNADIIDSQLKAVSDKATSALPSSSYTAADILNKLKTVDGVNSGLDADLFKGRDVLQIEDGGTAATTVTGAQRRLLGAAAGIPSDYAQMDYGIYQAVYSGLKENDPFTNTGGKRITAICLSGSSVSEKVIIATSVDGGNAGETFIGHVNTEGLGWRQLVDSSSLNSLMQSALQSGGVSVVKSVQRGVINIATGSLTNTATINAVNTNKAVALYSGFTTGGNSFIYFAHLTLTNSTTVTATRNTESTGSEQGNIVPYQVIEFY